MQEGNINKRESFSGERGWLLFLGLPAGCRWGKGRAVALEVEEEMGPVPGWGR